MYWGAASSLALFAFSKRPDAGTCDTRRGDTVQLFSSSSSSSSSSVGNIVEERTVDASKYQDLLKWLESKGAEINSKIEIRSSPEGYGSGAFVKSAVVEDEVLFTVPRSACLTLEDATGDEKCGEAFKNLIEKAGPGANTVVMAGYMAKEYLLMQEDSSASSPWAAYFQTLPWERGVNNQEHILFWDNDMVQDLLDGSLCYGEATGLRREVALANKIMGSVVAKPIRVARGEMAEGFQFPWNTQPTPEGPPEGLKEAVDGAFVCLLTRAFQDGDGEGNEEKLVPLLDMLQHQDEPNVKHAMRKEDGTVEVRARCDIEPDTELFNQYRSEEEESMPYSRFFTRFGFVPGVVEPMENLLKDKSSIFYPSVAEV